MAYGKDDAGRAAVQQGAFRGTSGRTFNQASRALSRNRFPGQGGEGGRGGSMYWIDQYQPPIGYDGQIRLLAGQFKQEELVQTGPGYNDVDVVEVDSEFVKFVEHFDGRNQKSTICSAGALANYRDKRKDCYGCDIYWETAERGQNGRVDSKRMSKQSKYAFAVFDYRPYHQVEVIDKETGRPKVNNSGQSYKDWKVCVGRGCDYCKAGIEVKVGHSTHWAINYTQLQAFRATERDVGRSCAVCGGVDCVQSLGWMCGSCGECVIDMATTELQPKELIDRTENEQVCPYCNFTDFLTEVYECPPCAARGVSGLRATLFDVDLWVTMMQLEGNKKQLVIKKFSAPHQIPPEFVEAAKPIELLKKYRPDSLDAQAKKFGHAPGAAQPPQGQEAQQPQGAPPPQQPTQQFGSRLGTNIPYQNPNTPKLTG